MTFHLMLFPGFKNKAFTMSYDDGVRQDVRLIEIMQKYGLKGTFNLNSGLMQGGIRLTPEEIYDVYIQSGNEVAVHGVKHHSLPSLTDTQIVEEIFSDRKALEKLTGGIVNGMAYPNGPFDDRVIDVLKKCGILYARTVVSTHDCYIRDDWLKMPATCHHNDEKLFELIDVFLSDNSKEIFWRKNPRLFYLWGHSYEFDNDNNWDRIESVAKKVGKRDDIWYATNGEIVRYVEAYKALVYSADGSSVYNPSAVDLYIRTFDDKQVVVPAGQHKTL